MNIIPENPFFSDDNCKKERIESRVVASPDPCFFIVR
jgi:hypothetical protein